MNEQQAGPGRDDITSHAGPPGPRGPAEADFPEQKPRDSAGSDRGDGRRNETATELAGLRERVAEAEDMRLRALADLDNMRKRCAAQVGLAVQDTQAAVAAQWLPVVDNLERALDHAQADPEAIIEGLRSVRDQALSVLASLGFPRRDDLGLPFDPARHDAVAVTSDPDAGSGTVVDVVRPGYGDGDHQLRPAQVVVAKAG